MPTNVSSRSVHSRNAGQSVVSLANQLVNDPTPAVRREVAVALRNTRPKDKLPLVVALLEKYDGKDRVYLEACGLAAEGAEAKVWQQLQDSLNQDSPVAWSDAFARITWRLQPEAALPALVARAKNSLLTLGERKLAIDTIAFTRTRSAVDAMAELLNEPGLIKDTAIAWMLNRATGEWREFNAMPLLKKHGIYDPGKVTVQEVKVPLAPKTKLPSAKEIAKLKGNAETGKLIATACTTCHRINGTGVDYGPDLRKWVANQGVEQFIEAVINPSAGIAHGFDGEIISLKDGREIHGLIYSQGDPMMIRSTGGITQLIPKQMVKGKIQPLKRSLMLSAEQLGMNAQLVADLAAFFQTYN